MTMKSLLENFQKYIEEEELEEATRASKEGVALPSTLEQLKQYVVSNTETPTHFIQFSNVNKLGINPSSKFNTPMGIYAYPLIESLYDQYRTGKLPFASNREYTIVFKTNPGSKILVAGRSPDGSEGETINNREYVAMMKLLFTKKAALMAGNPNFHNEASEYQHGGLLQVMPSPPSESNESKKERLDEITVEFFSWLKDRFSPHLESLGWEPLLEEFRDTSNSGKLSKSRDQQTRSPLWGIVMYTIKDWASYPHGEISEYDELIESFEKLEAQNLLRSLKVRAETSHRWHTSQKIKKFYLWYRKGLSSLRDNFTEKQYGMMKHWLMKYERKLADGSPEGWDSTLGKLSKEVQQGYDPSDPYWDLDAGSLPEPLGIRGIAKLHKEKLLKRWPVGPDGPPEPEEMTRAWKRIEGYAQNRSNLGRLWYGSMFLAGNTGSSFNKSIGRGMKVWRTIFKNLWGIDGIVDMTSALTDDSYGDYLIHEAEPIQAVFFSKSAIEHVTTLKNTETPKAIRRRGEALVGIVRRLVIPAIRKEWETVYAPIGVKGWSNSGNVVSEIEKEEKELFEAWEVGGIMIEEFENLSNPPYDNLKSGEKWWRKLVNITVEELGQQINVGGYDQDMLEIRALLSQGIHSHWLDMVEEVVNYKVKEIYKFAGHVPTRWSGEDATPPDRSKDLRLWFRGLRRSYPGSPTSAFGTFDLSELLRQIGGVVKVHDAVNKIYLSTVVSPDDDLDSEDFHVRMRQAEKATNRLIIRGLRRTRLSGLN